MNNLKWFIAFCMLVGIVKLIPKAPPIQTVSLASVRGLQTVNMDQNAKIDLCMAKSKCVFVYITPWCGACHSFLAQLDRIKPRLEQNNVGMLLVVGADEDRNKEVEMHDQYIENAILDTEAGDFMQQNEINMFPTLIVTESPGKVLAYGQSAETMLNSLLKKQ